MFCSTSEQGAVAEALANVGYHYKKEADEKLIWKTLPLPARVPVYCLKLPRAAHTHTHTLTHTHICIHTHSAKATVKK